MSFQQTYFLWLILLAAAIFLYIHAGIKTSKGARMRKWPVYRYFLWSAGLLVPEAQAEAGGKLMYYGGDAIDLMIIIVLCYHRYMSARPRPSITPGTEI